MCDERSASGDVRVAGADAPASGLTAGGAASFARSRRRRWGSVALSVLLALSLVPGSAWGRALSEAPTSRAEQSDENPALQGDNADQGSGASEADSLSSTASVGSEEAAEPTPPTGSDGPSDPAAAQEPIELSGVELSEPDRCELGVMLTAKAYTGVSWAPDYVEEGVVYTWKYTMKDPTGYSFSDSDWTVVEGEAGPEFVVEGEQYAGACFSVEARLGESSVVLSNYSAVGPFKKAGAYEIYAVSFSRNDEPGATEKFQVGDTITVKATEKVEGSSSHPEIPSDKLASVTWAYSPEKNGGAEVLPAYQDKVSFEIPASLGGMYLTCTVNAGANDYERTTRNPIAAVDAVSVKSLELTGSDAGDAVAPGDTLTVRALDYEGNDVTGSLSGWTWYTATTSYGSNETLIEGASGTTFTVPDDASYVGKYITVHVTDGFGAESKAASGKVSIAGAVELYQVKAEGDPRIGSTLTAAAYKENSYTEVSPSDTVGYQWQYADTNTTLDSRFADIAGATGRTYVVDESMQGKYLRVKAVSDNEVVSTEKPYYGSTQPVDPLGPVTQEGQYELSGVALASSGQGMQAGNIITPKAQVEDGYREEDAPSDAKLTYIWKAADAPDGDFAELDSDYDREDGVIELTEDLRGRYLKVEASALDNTVASAAYLVVGAGEYDLLRITATPQIDSSTVRVFTGDAVSASVQAKKLDSVSYGDDVTDEVSVQWLVGEIADGDFAPIEGASSAQLTVPSEAAGKYLKAVATSGSSSVELTSALPVVDASSLAGIAAKLEEEGWYPDPVFGEDANVNDLLEEELARMGADDVAVRVSSVAFAAENDAVRVSVSAADDQTNGDVSFAEYLPEKHSGWASLIAARSADVVFELSRAGEGPQAFEPSRRLVVPWDEDAARDTLSEAAEGLGIRFAAGDAGDSVTQDMTLPHEVPDASWAKASWDSLSDAVEVEGYSWDAQSTGVVTRTASDQQAQLVATVSFNGSEVPETAFSKSFDVTIKGDPEQVEEEKAALEKKVDEGFVPENVKTAAGNAADLEMVTGDLALPTPRTIGVDGRYYEVAYSASSDAVVANGYAAQVYRGLPGTKAQSVTVTCTVTSRDNPEITASKSLDVVIAPLDEQDIDDELTLMSEAKERFFEGIANGQPKDAVQGDLHAFQKAYRAEDGSLAWTYDYAATNAVDGGIVPDDIDSSHPSELWNLFRSSEPSVIQHENLLLAQQPTYNTEVVVEACLTSENYARYAERYADDPRWGSVFAALSRQPVQAMFTVTGTTGQEDPRPPASEVSATVSMTGRDAAGNLQVWSRPFTAELPAGTTAAELTEQMLERENMAFEASGAELGWMLSAVTSPFDSSVTLETKQTGSVWEYWQFFVNGELGNVGAGGYVLSEGDEIEWVYGSSGSLPSDDEVVADPDAPHPDLPSSWPGFGTGSAATDASTPTEGAETSWSAALKDPDDFSTYLSDPIIVDGKILVAVGSKLEVRDAATGARVAAVSLAAPINSVSRMVYADGMVVVPLSGGRLQAIAIASLTTRWVTEKLPDIGSTGLQQPLSSLSVGGGRVYYATTSATWSGDSESGYLRCVNLEDGSLVWERRNGQAGYYWSGAALAGDWAIIGDDAGRMQVFDAATGAVVSSVSLGAAVRSAAMAGSEAGTVFSVTKDGVLHKLSLDTATGALSETTRVRFASSSTSTPTVANGKVYVGGTSLQSHENAQGSPVYGGLLAIIDEKTLSIDHAVTTFGEEGKPLPADVKASPLVSSQEGGTYVYFTCNALPGGVYSYRVGDAAAKLLYEPDEAGQNYSMSSVVCDENGVLYYVNDSGMLFAVKGGSSGGSGDNGGAGLVFGLGGGSGSWLVALFSGAAGDASGEAPPAAKAESSEAKTLSAAAAGALDEVPQEMGGSQDETPSSVPWLPVAGIIVGVLMLACVAAWAASSRRATKGGAR